MKSEPGTIQQTAQLRAVFIDIILLLLTKTDKHKQQFTILPVGKKLSCSLLGEQPILV